MSFPEMKSAVDVSVVIGFMDWGVERLLLSVSSLVESFGTLTAEVIVSDYGSKECPELRDSIEALGARYVYTDTNGIWSRSRALNAGFAVSVGRVLVSTDADMLFNPGSMDVIGRRIIDDPSEALLLQCRDLPMEYDSEGVVSSGLDWTAFEASSTFRPRWGMGGMMAVSRDGFKTIRGFDERMEIYGGEDMDFAQRLRWAGFRLSWLEDPSVRMYHMWHAPTRSEMDKSPEGRAAIAFNRDIVLNDKSYIRNVTGWKHSLWDADPLATVVISTRNRAEYIGESINSVLAQTVRDIEIVVVDDGSTDNTPEVMASFTDPRIRYYRRGAKGIAASRNFAATLSRGKYTVIHDDDDLMFPDRIENHFTALRAGASGSYGGWIDFDNTDGSVVAANPGKRFTFESLLFNGRIFAHATLMLETRLIKLLKYDEKLRSGSDFNLAIRLGRTGATLNHTGHFHLIRRLHDKQVTTTDSGHQKSAARLTLTVALSSIPAGRQNALRKELKDLPSHPVMGLQDPSSWVKPYLPDHLVRRDITLQVAHVDEIPLSIAECGRLQIVEVLDHLNDEDSTTTALLSSASWNDMALLRSAGIDCELSSSQYLSEEVGEPSVLENPMSSLIERALDRSDAANHVVITSQGGFVPSVAGQLVAHSTVRGREGTFFIRIHRIDDKSRVRELLDAWQNNDSFDIEFHQKQELPGAAWDIFEGLTK